MIGKKVRTLFALFLSAALVLSACQQTPEITPANTSTPFTPAQSTATPEPTPSPTATTPAETALPTSEPGANGPVQVTQWEPLALANVLLPELAGEINPENVHQVVPLAVWGNPRANTIALSADGQILTVGTDLGAALYDSQSYAQIIQILTPNPVSTIAYSQDNELIAFGQQEGVIDVISKDDLTLLTRLTFEQPADFLERDIKLVFSQDSKSLILMAQSPDQIHLIRWDTETWFAAVNLTLRQGLVSYLSSELDLAGVIYGQPDLLLQSLSYPDESDLLDMPTSISPAFWNAFDTYTGEIVPASDGTFILINNGISILSWQVLSDEYSYLLDNYPDNLPDPCTQAPASCQNTHGELSWTCESTQAIPSIELIALTPDDVMVLISRNDGLTEFRSASDTSVLWTLDVNFTSVSFSPGSEFFFGLRPNGMIEKRATQDGTLIDFFEQTPNELQDMAFSPDGTILVVGYSDGWVRVYSTANGELLGVLDGNAHSLAFSRDGNILAAGLADGTVRIFNLLAGSYSDLTPGHQAAVNALAFSLDGTQLVAGSADCTVSLWQVDDEYRVRLLNPGGQSPFQINAVAQNRDSSWFISAGNLPEAVIFNRADFTSKQLLDFGPFTDLALSSDNVYLAAAGEQVWFNPLTNNQSVLTSIPVTPADSGLAYKLAFNPTNSLLAYGSDEALSLWSIPGQTTLSSIAYPLAGNYIGQPVSLSFSPYGNLIGLGMDNGLILIFGIPTTVTE